MLHGHFPPARFLEPTAGEHPPTEGVLVHPLTEQGLVDLLQASQGEVARKHGTEEVGVIETRPATQHLHGLVEDLLVIEPQLSGRGLEKGTEFDVEVSGQVVTVLVEVRDDRVTARVTEHADTLDPGPLTLPVVFLATPDGRYSGSLTLPRRADLGWVAHSTSIEHVKLAAGGDVRGWLEAAGATVEGASLTCGASAPAVAVVAVAATRVRPSATGHDLDEPPPWELPPPTLMSGAAGSGRWSNHDGSSSVVAKLELLPKLAEAIDAAIAATGAPRVEYGIVEHFFAYANVDDYRELHGIYGLLSVDHPRKHSLSGYLARRIADMKDEALFHKVAGTGYWAYNSDVSGWSALGVPSTAPLAAWKGFATERGRHPKEWTAAALLWGASPMLDRSWSGSDLPGTDRPLALGDVPTSADDPRLADFVDSFDARSAFGDDLEPLHQRMVANAAKDLGFPRDVGMLRAALWVEHRSDAPSRAFIDAVLKSLTWLV
jgi:hypothetical protein